MYLSYYARLQMKFGVVTEVLTFFIITQVSSGLKQIMYSLKSCVTIGMMAKLLFWPPWITSQA